MEEDSDDSGDDDALSGTDTDTSATSDGSVAAAPRRGRRGGGGVGGDGGLASDGDHDDHEEEEEEEEAPPGGDSGDDAGPPPLVPAAPSLPLAPPPLGTTGVRMPLGAPVPAPEECGHLPLVCAGASHGVVVSLVPLTAVKVDGNHVPAHAFRDLLPALASSTLIDSANWTRAPADLLDEVFVLVGVQQLLGRRKAAILVAPGYGTTGTMLRIACGLVSNKTISASLAAGTPQHQAWQRIVQLARLATNASARVSGRGQAG